MKRLHLKSILFFFCFFILLLILNVFNISMINHNELAKQASAQRKSTISTGYCRGCIYDKNMIPIASSPYNNEPEEITSSRYGTEPICTHTIGYLNSDGKGANGLEKIFDDKLADNTTPQNTYLTDPFGNKISEQPVSKANTTHISPQNLKTTIDYKIQKIAENAADLHISRGAIIILDIDNFDIVAAVSRPNFDQYNIKDYLHKTDAPLVNRCFSPYNAGSIFKTITSAAILENNYNPDLEYRCTGLYNAEGKEFLCNKSEGHGNISFKTAYADSCNCFFYNHGIITTGENIIATAKNFGLGKKLLDLPISESPGHLPDRFTYTDRECANISIGQGEILITPLQAANIVATVANGGISKKINLTDSITDQKGNLIKNLRHTENKRVISAKNAAIICEMMREAVLEGTAQSVQNGKIAIAGKTGTAQTGWQENGKTMTHGWFCGFFPYENPEYAMAVFAENGKSGSRACIPVFRKIALDINNLYKLQ